MPISAGTYTIGTGGNYATIAAAFSDIATTLTGNLTLTLISDVSLSGQAVLNGKQLAGFTLTLQGDSVVVNAASGSGRRITIAFGTGGDGIFFEDLHGGTLVTKNLQGRRTSFNDSTRGLFHVRSNNATTAVYTYRAENIVHDGNLGRGRGFRISGGAGLTLRLFNCIVCDCRDNAGSGGEGLADTHAGPGLVENCIFQNNYRGVVPPASKITCRNVIALDNTNQDFNTVSNIVGRFCISKDSTAGGAFSAGSAGNFQLATVATQFASTSKTNANYFRLNDTTYVPQVARAGELPTIAQNTQGIRGDVRPSLDGFISVGSDQRLIGYVPPGPSPDADAGCCGISLEINL